jgi:hypothetical protein
MFVAPRHLPWMEPLVPGTGSNALCETYGLLVAQGVISREDALAAVARAVAHRRPEVEEIGSPLAGNIAMALTLATERWQRTRRDAGCAVRKAIAPLLMDRRPSTVILRVAHETNADLGFPEQHLGPLLIREVREIIREEVAWWVRLHACRERRHAR